jgi:hypothetical protein
MMMLMLLAALTALPVTLPEGALEQPRPVSEYVEALQAPDSELVARVAELERRLDEVKRVADDTAGCIVDAFVAHGADLLSTGVAWHQCPDCKEANPAGLNSDARVGLKIGALGVEIGTCYAAAKKGHNALKVTQWTLRLSSWAIVLNNIVVSITGKPFIKWGLPAEVTP